MPYARIYSPSKTAMQSGKAKTGYWVLEYNISDAEFYDPIMGWTGSDSTLNQVSLEFKTLESALDFARGLGLDYRVETVLETPQTPSLRKKAYADNFRCHKPPLN